MTVAATDGSALGNPGPAGWAWVTDDGREGCAGARHSTNNRMELRAVIELLQAMDPSEPLTIQADSEYVVNIFTKWLEGWRKRGMRTSEGKPVENQDLIEYIDALLKGRQVTFEWVRGHAGHGLNERADAMANGAARRAAAKLGRGATT
jgi:ribonuclease HI